MLAFFAAEHAAARASTDEKIVDAIQTSMATIQVVNIPISNLKAVKSDGEIFFVSEDARFVIRGQIFDSWQKRSLGTLDEINRSITTKPVENMNVDWEKLTHFKVGKGDTFANVFVDPLCGYCHKLLSVINNSRRLKSDYTFRFIVVPALGTKSDDLVRRMHCASNSELVPAAFMDRTLEYLPTKKDCDMSGYEKTLALAQLVGVSGVPFLIAPDGRFKKGIPASINNWLKAEK